MAILQMTVSIITGMTGAPLSKSHTKPKKPLGVTLCALFVFKTISTLIRLASGKSRIIPFDPVRPILQQTKTMKHSLMRTKTFVIDACKGFSDVLRIPPTWGNSRPQLQLRFSTPHASHHCNPAMCMRASGTVSFTAKSISAVRVRRVSNHRIASFSLRSIF